MQRAYGLEIPHYARMSLQTDAEAITGIWRG
jgi:hypothetical protein